VLLLTLLPSPSHSWRLASVNSRWNFRGGYTRKRARPSRAKVTPAEKLYGSSRLYMERGGKVQPANARCERQTRTKSPDSYVVLWSLLGSAVPVYDTPAIAEWSARARPSADSKVRWWHGYSVKKQGALDADTSGCTKTVSSTRWL